MGSDFSMHNDCDKRQPLELTQTSIARTIYHTCLVLFALGINCKFKQYTLLDFFSFSSSPLCLKNALVLCGEFPLRLLIVLFLPVMDSPLEPVSVLPPSLLLPQPSFWSLLLLLFFWPLPPRLFSFHALLFYAPSVHLAVIRTD